MKDLISFLIAFIVFMVLVLFFLPKVNEWAIKLADHIKKQTKSFLRKEITKKDVENCFLDSKIKNLERKEKESDESIKALIEENNLLIEENLKLLFELRGSEEYSIVLKNELSRTS